MAISKYIRNGSFALLSLSFFLPLAWIYLSMSEANAQQQSPEHVVLDPSGLIEVPPYGAMAWFPDSRRLAIASNGIRIVDTVEGTVSPPLTKQDGLRLFISPDGKYLAALLGIGFRLFATETWSELAAYNSQTGNCKAGYPRGLAFTADSSSIWLGCGNRGIQGAIKLSLPNLEVVDRLEVAPEWTPQSDFSRGYFIHIQSGLPILHFVTVDYEPVGLSLPGGRRPARQQVRVYDLESKRQLMDMTFERKEDWPSAMSPSVYLSDDLSAYLVYSGYPLPSGSVSSIDVATKTKITVFYPPSDQQSAPSQTKLGVLLGRRLLFKGDKVIASAIKFPSREGTLLSWNYKTGKLAQEIKLPYALSEIILSPDKTKIAVMKEFAPAEQRTIQIYTVRD